MRRVKEELKIKNYKIISYYVVAYSKNKKVIDVVEVTEKPYGASSRVISVNRNASYVNIFVKNVDGLEINTNVIKPIPVRKIKYYTACTTVTIFSTLFAVRHLVILAMCGLHAKDFMYSDVNYIMLAITLVISLLYWLFATISLRKKNHLNRRGGSHEYEFF